jgi:hypothetical protein
MDNSEVVVACISHPGSVQSWQCHAFKGSVSVAIPRMSDTTGSVRVVSTRVSF